MMILGTIFFKTRLQARVHAVKTGNKAPTTKSEKGWGVELVKKDKLIGGLTKSQYDHMFSDPFYPESWD
jgi:hypothetical protein